MTHAQAEVSSCSDATLVSKQQQPLPKSPLTRTSAHDSGLIPDALDVPLQPELQVAHDRSLVLLR